MMLSQVMMMTRPSRRRLLQALPSLFDTPSTCFMAKATKVQSHDDGCESESDSDDDDEQTKDELIDM